jgi:hypothetical protein
LALGASLAPEVNADILRYAHEPATDFALLKPPKSPIGTQKGLLGGILGKATAPEKSPAGAENEPAVTGKDLGKVLRIAGDLIAAGKFFVRESRMRLEP